MTSTRGACVKASVNPCGNDQEAEMDYAALTTSDNHGVCVRMDTTEPTPVRTIYYFDVEQYKQINKYINNAVQAIQSSGGMKAITYTPQSRR
jgi:hypothetical protein